MKRSFLSLALVVPLTLVDVVDNGRQTSPIDFNKDLQQDTENPPPPEPTHPTERDPLCMDTPPMAVRPIESDRLLTISQQPTFLIYFPYTSEAIGYGTLKIQDRTQSDTIYQSQFQLPETPGFLSVTANLPTGTLQQGEYYRWFVQFDVECIPTGELEVETKTVTLLGWVRRLEATSDRRFSIEAGEPDIWYGSLARLAELRRNNPNNITLQEQWDTLLQLTNSDKLEAVAGEPILDPATIVEDND
mgnify:CR=1 FL=1